MSAAWLHKSSSPDLVNQPLQLRCAVSNILPVVLMICIVFQKRKSPTVAV
jgi:hypothetical protein